MADLEKPGEPTSQPVAAPAGGEPQAQVGEAAPQAGATPSIPEKFKGKSPEEIAAAYLNSEKEKGRLAQEYGELKEVANRLWAEYQARQQQTTQPQEKPQEKTDEFDWEKPTETVAQIVERKLAEREAAQRQWTLQNLNQRAATAHEEGRAVMGKNARLFEGIERDVEGAVFQSLAPYVNQGYDVSEQLRNPKTWEAAAMLIRYGRGDLDRISFSPQPMSATAGELPSQTRQQKDTGDEAAIPSEAREWAKEMGMGNLTPKQIKEILDKGNESYVGRRR